MSRNHTVLLWCTAYKLREHVHELYTLNSFSDSKGLNNLIVLFPFYTNLYSVAKSWNTPHPSSLPFAFRGGEEYKLFNFYLALKILIWKKNIFRLL